MKRILLLLLCLLSLPMASADQGEGDSLSVFPGGMGIHTLKPDPPRLIQIMPRRLDADGHFVLNPGLGMVYRTEGYQFQTLFIKDSFDNPAGAVTAGYEFETGYQWLDIGASLGVYARKSPRGCYQFPDGVYCYGDTNEIPLLYHAQMGSNYLDIALLPLFSLGVHFPIFSGVNFDLALNSAVFLSFITAGLRFDL